MSMLIEVWGDYACFSRPEMKTERVSYDVMTPSAARGLVEAIYWHPGMKYHIDRIYLLKPVQFASIRRNEVKATLLSSAVLSAAKGGEVPMLCTAENIQQRAALVLQDVHYVIECHFTMTEKAAPGDNPGKFQDILPLTQDLGFMLYDLDYSDPENIRSQFFRAKLENGVLDCRDVEVFT